MLVSQKEKQPNPAVKSDGNNFPTVNADTNTVSARDLYFFLQVKSDFTHWIKKMIDYGFTEGVDYALVKKNVRSEKNGFTTHEYDLTLDTAKEISMIQRSAKGKEARQYFIECERRFQAAKAVYEKAEATPKVDAKGQMSLFDLPDTDIIRAQRLAMDVALQAKNGSKTAQLLRILTPYLFKNQGA